MKMPKGLLPTSRARHYFLNFVESESFQTKITQLRESYDIPAKGFRSYDFTESFNRSLMYFPKEWKHSSDKDRKREFNLALKKATATFELGSDLFWNLCFRVYAFHNRVEKRFFEKVLPGQFPGYVRDVCVIQNVRESMVVHEAIGARDDLAIRHLKTLSETHPVAIFIARGASQRDVRAYIAKMWSIMEAERAFGDPVSDMERRRSTYGSVVSLKKTKVRTVRARDAFILSKDKWARSKIAAAVQKKFGGKKLSEKYVNLIISRGKKRAALERTIDMFVKKAEEQHEA